MSSKEEILGSYLETLTGLPVYADVKKEGVNSCIVYQRISTKRYRTHSGTSNLERVRFQISVFGTTKKSVREMAELIKDDLDGNTTNGFKVSVLENDFDIPENKIDGSANDIQLYHAILDFFVW